MIVATCGSARFKEQINGISDQLESRGFVVLRPPLHPLEEVASVGSPQILKLAWQGATLAHFERIRRAQAVVFVNPGGYMGASTSVELGVAAALGKFVLALSHDEELAREVLLDRVLEVEEPAAAASAIAHQLRPEAM